MSTRAITGTVEEERQQRRRSKRRDATKRGPCDMRMLVGFDKGLREELTPRERHALAVECGPMGGIAIRERAVMALCNRAAAGDAA
jgi:hypothetical protein